MANKLEIRGNYAPASKAIAVTPNDGTDLTFNSRWLSFTSAPGNIVVIFEGDTASTTLTGLPSGLYPFAVKRVLATGTTVTNIVAYV